MVNNEAKTFEKNQRRKKLSSVQIDAGLPSTLRTEGRPIFGASAILLPMNPNRTVDWEGFDAHVIRTLDAGLTPAINMDTGYANLIDQPTRLKALDRTQRLAGGADYIAGVFVGDEPGAAFDFDAYQTGIADISSRGGTPIFFQSFGLAGQPEDLIYQSYERLSERCQDFYFFELGKVFAPFGAIYSIELYERLMMIPNCLGAKHSSLRRIDEWQRLQLRNRLRPEFRVLTGNDLAIDMVMYGSDYLLGLSTFAPDAFALRDRWWQSQDPRFYELNDLLQYLGAFTFRSPTSAYKHSAAMFLKKRGWITCDDTYPGAPTRPDSDREVLSLIAEDIDKIFEGAN